MIFQLIDKKDACKGVYANNEMHASLPQAGSATWEYHASLPADVICAYLYCNGKIDEACPTHMRESWYASNKKLKAFLNSFLQAKVDLKQYCFYDLVPEHFLIEYFELKNQITKHVIENYERPPNYDFLRNLARTTESIRKQKLNVDFTVLNKFQHKFAARNVIRKIKKTAPYIKYNIFGTRTGRLTTTTDSFPILTLKKEYRAALKPNNDLFVELDYNAAELRTLLALMGKEQPKEDIHKWNAKNVFRNLQSREEAKERIFAWLYNPDSKDYLANRAYDKTSVKEKYWDGKIVTTPFGRQIEADDFHALNYLIQSTTADMVLRQMNKIFDLLKNHKSCVAFTIHDSLIIDLAKEDKGVLANIFNIFSKTELGDFSISVRAGKNFGAMRKVEWI